MTILKLRRERWEVPAGITIRDAILKIGQQPEALLATIEGRLVNEQRVLQEGDVVRLVAVISGGMGCEGERGRESGREREG